MAAGFNFLLFSDLDATPMLYSYSGLAFFLCSVIISTLKHDSASHVHSTVLPRGQG